MKPSLLLVLLLALPASAQETRPATPAVPAPPATPGRIVEVVCYEGSALVTREVEVPAGEGRREVTVGPLPRSLRAETIYAESPTEGVRVLSTRYRQRTERDAADERVRDLQAEVERLTREIELAQAKLEAIGQDLQFVQQLQGFATSNIDQAAGDADLKAGGFIEFADYVVTRRRELLEARVETQRAANDLQHERDAAQQRLAEAQAGGGGRVVREATVVVDNPDGGAARVRVAYLVDAAGWRPQYRLRAGAGLDEATLEYLAAVFQNTGEDWREVRLTLSTASPNLNAAPPDLEPVQVALVSGDADRQRAAAPKLEAAREALLQAQSAYGQQVGGSGGGGRFGDRGSVDNTGMLNAAGNRISEAEVLGDAATGDPATALTEGQSVTFKLDGRVTVPWRDDEQLLEIARRPLDPDVFYKAVPVLTPNVYRLASFENGGEGARVILPGPCGVYLGGDFVGRTALPLVAVGRPFTVGLGIDPQLAVTRQLVSRDTDVRGGNQVRRVEYVLRVESFKDAAVPVRLWDRLPTGPEGDGDALGVDLVANSAELSDDADYGRDERPDGLLRWDLALDGGGTREVRYAYTLAFDRSLKIGGFTAK